MHREGAPNILVVSYFYPPVTKPRAVQVARLMSASACGKLVFCGEGGGESPLIGEDPRHRRIPVPWTMPRWRKSLHSALRKVGGPFAGSSEPYRPWMSLVIDAVKRALQSTSFRPDAVVTFGHPWVDHEIGLVLKRMLDLPLLAHFSDPWVDNPLVGMPNESARAALRRRESAVVHGADRLVFTSAETVDLVMANYPDRLRGKASVLPHSFDEALFPDKPDRDTGAIRCLGKWYGDRRPDVLIDAIQHIHRDRPGFLSDAQFEIIGNYDRSAQPATTLPEGVRFRPAVPYLESLRLMATAEALFLIDAPADESVFLPSKLIEYIGSKRPVFGITPPGTADRLIRRYGGMTADPRDPEGVAKMLCTFLPSVPDWSVNKTVRDEFQATTVAERFDRLIETCLREN